MPNPLNLNDAADLIDAGIQDIFLKGSEAETRDFAKYYNVETGVKDYYLKDSSLSGLGYAGRITENAAVTAASPVQGYDQTYTQVHFGILLSFTEAMWKFGVKKRDLVNVTSEARKSVSDKREQLCADRLDNSFSSSYSVQDISGNYSVTITGGNGVAFISASQTREDGGTAWGNRITDGSTVNLEADYPGLKAAHRTAALITDPRGKRMNINLDTIVVFRGSNPHFRFTEILGALNRGFIPGSADRDVGAVAPYKLVVTPWIQTNTGYWWMFDSSKMGPRYGLQYKESQDVTLEGPNVVFKTGEIQYKATAWFDIGFNDARNWVGSKSTNAA